MDLEALLAKIESDEIKQGVIDAISAETEKGKALYREKDKELMNYKHKAKEWLEGKTAIESKVEESTMTIAQLNEKLNQVTTNLENEKKTAKNNKLQAELTNKIGNMFYSTDLLIKDLIREGRADISDNGTTIDGVPIDEAIEKLKSERKSDLRMSQKGGTGDSGGSEQSRNSEEDAFLAKLLQK